MLIEKELQKNEANQGNIFILNQMKAIILNNLIINHRHLLFWKEVAMLGFILGSSIILAQARIYENSQSFEAKLTFVIYNILAMLLIARFSVMAHMDNRKKFVYFQKAYGLNTLAYIVTWVLYSLFMGAIKFFIYMLIVYFYLKGNNDYFQPYFHGYGYPWQNFFINYQQSCLMNFLCFFSIYSYSLFMAVIIQHNQIGLKLLTPFIITGFLCLQQGSYFFLINMDKLIYISPIGWLTSISSYGYLPPKFFTLSKQAYIYVFLAQFFVPLVFAILIDYIKIQRFQIKEAIKRQFNKVKSKINSSLKIDLISRDSELPQVQSEDVLIKVSNLNKTQGKKNILVNINLSISKGDIIILYGSNGSGKSTLLSILTNKDHISMGDIQLRKKIRFGVSLEDNYFQESLTVRENFLFYAMLKGIVIDSKDNSYFQRFQLIDFADKEYFKISGGNRKKMSLACAFLGDNDIILLDEPTMGIDYAVKRDIQKIINNEIIRQGHVSIIISTCTLNASYMDSINKVWIIDCGEIVFNQRIVDINASKSFIIAKVDINQNMSLIDHFCKQIQDKPFIRLSKSANFIGLQFEEKYLQLISESIRQNNLQGSFELRLSDARDKIQQKYKNILEARVNDRKQQHLQKLKDIYRQLQVKQSFWNMTLAATIIKTTQIMPSIIDMLYYLFIPLICWGFIEWILNTNDPKYFYGLYIITFPNLCNFLYTDIVVTHLAYKENHYQSIIFKMGMKKIPYWIISYLLFTIIIFLPFLLTVAAGWQNEQGSLSELLLQLFGFCLSFIAVSFFVSFFFTSSFVCFSFISIIRTIVNNYMYSFYPKGQLKIILQFFIPYYQFYQDSSKLISFSSFFMYLIINSTLAIIIYRIRNYNRRMKSEEMLENTYEGAIQQKLKVLDILEQRQANDNVSLIISNLYLKYSQKLMGIKGLNLLIEKGTVFGLLGMNGSGKSTTIKLILNDIFKTFGNIYFGQRQLASQTSQIYEQISISPQFNYLAADMRVDFHLRTICALKGIHYSLQKEIIDCFLSLFGLEDCANMKIKFLSGGSRRKLKFISALIGRPKYLLMDEPTLGVDAMAQKYFGQILTFSIDQFRSLCVYITHQLEEVQRFCSKIGIMKKGGLVLSDQTKNLIERYSRGVQINLRSNHLKVIKKEVGLAFQGVIRVFQSTVLQQSNTLRVLIPYEEMNFNVCLKLIRYLREKNLICGYDLKGEQLMEVFNYLVYQTETTVIMASSLLKVDEE